MPDAPVKKTRQEQARKRLLILSATQFETYELCARKWWFEKVRRLPTMDTTATIFGTVLHAVIERYLNGDKQGRDAQGSPIDLYPVGWTLAKNRYTGAVDGEVSPGEQEIIRTLVAKAIEGGVLECFDGREVEYEFRETLTREACPTCNGIPPTKTPCKICGCAFGSDHDLQVHELAAAKMSSDNPTAMRAVLDPSPWLCPTCGGDGVGVHIQITGFIDYMTLDGIQDHKSVKRMEYAKSKNALRENIQLLICAKVLIELYRKQGRSVPEKINIRHNVYCKDPNDLRVRKTEIFVTPEEIDDNWKRMQEMGREMASLRARAKSWHDTPEPKSFAHACNAYGGCRYRPICQGQETPEQFEAQRAKVLDNNTNEVHNATLLVSDTNTLPFTENAMGIADKIARQQTIQTGQVNAMPPGGGINPPASAPVTQPLQPILSQAVQNAIPAQGEIIPNHRHPNPNPVHPTAPSGVDGAVPWANPNCVACRGLGMATNGAPCRICDLKATSFGKKPSTEYSGVAEGSAPEPLGDGTIYWKDKATGVDGVSPMRLAEGALPVKVESKVEVPPQVQAAPVQEAAAVTQTFIPPGPVVTQVFTLPTSQLPHPNTQSATTLETVLSPQGGISIPQNLQGQLGQVQGNTVEVSPPVQKRRGRGPNKPKTGDQTNVKYAPFSNGEAASTGSGLILILGCACNIDGAVMIGDLFREVIGNLAVAAIKAGQLPQDRTFYDLDPFRRRDTITESGQAIAAELGDAFVVVDRVQTDPDMRALVDALRPFATGGIVQAIAT